MKKKAISLTLLSTLVVSSLGLAGCSKNSTSYVNGTVNVYNCGEYIDEDVIKLFEEKYQIKVNYSTYNDNEMMYSKVSSGTTNYDVACPSDYMIQKLISEDRLYPLNYDNIPNIKYIAPEYLKTSETFDPGNLYSVPYCWGTVGILYNTKLVKEPITSWSSLFDPKYKDDILMMDSVRDAYGIAMKYLGYDLNTTDKAQIKEATELLHKQYPLVQAYVVDQVRDKMIAGEAAMGVIYSGEAIYTQRENPDLQYVVPKEGSNVWIDGWVILKDAKNKENAEKWINFMCDPDIALKNFEYITYSTPNSAAREMIEDEDIKNSKVAFPDTETLDRCTPYKYLGSEMDEYYLEEWNKVKY